MSLKKVLVCISLGHLPMWEPRQIKEPGPQGGRKQGLNAMLYIADAAVNAVQFQGARSLEFGQFPPRAGFF
jgi:hypothetical protein